jgi:hypothetical protein
VCLCVDMMFSVVVLFCCKNRKISLSPLNILPQSKENSVV